MDERHLRVPLVALALTLAVGCGQPLAAPEPRVVECYTDTFCQLSAGEDFCATWVDPALYFCSHTCDSTADCAAPFVCTRFVVHGAPVAVCAPDDWDAPGAPRGVAM